MWKEGGLLGGNLGGEIGWCGSGEQERKIIGVELKRRNMRGKSSSANKGGGTWQSSKQGNVEFIHNCPSKNYLYHHVFFFFGRTKGGYCAQLGQLSLYSVFILVMTKSAHTTWRWWLSWWRHRTKQVGGAQHVSVCQLVSNKHLLHTCTFVHSQLVQNNLISKGALSDHWCGTQSAILHQLKEIQYHSKGYSFIHWGLVLPPFSTSKCLPGYLI